MCSNIYKYYLIYDIFRIFFLSNRVIAFYYKKIDPSADIREFLKKERYKNKSIIYSISFNITNYKVRKTDDRNSKLIFVKLLYFII